MRRIRMLSLLLSALLLFGMLTPGLASEASDPVPMRAGGDRTQRDAPATLFTLGNTSDMMLQGGGRMVQTDHGLYFLGAVDGCIWFNDGETTASVVSLPAKCLNYIDGALWYALPEDGGFSLWRLPDGAQEPEPLGSFAGELKQFYAAEGGVLWFLADETIWRMPVGGEAEEIRTVPGIVSFVPTAFGMVYACGSLFAYDVYLDDLLLAALAEEYYVLDDGDDQRLVFIQAGDDCQISLRALFAGDGSIEAFTGFGEVPAEELLAVEDSGEEEAWETVEPIPATRAAMPTEYETRAVSQGMINIALRAYQMTEIQWTPVRSVQGWKSRLTYEAGTTYKGIPYGQPMDKYYVPWSANLSKFLEVVADANSAFYTQRASNPADGLSYATDCSAFVSWAWQTNTRLGTGGLADSTYATLISSSSYASAQIGDCINDATTHVLLVTDVKYDSNGAISAIEVAHANVSSATNYCCARIWYGSGYSRSLADLQSNYFAQGFKLYRSNTRNSVTFTPDPNVPVSHDGSVTQTPVNQTNVHYGMDVSKWQGRINWSTASKYVEFAILRVLYGKDEADTEFDRNVTGCVKNKIPYGVYVYSLASSPAEAKAEAEECLKQLGTRKPDLPIFFDVEDQGTILRLTSEELYPVVKAFCDTIEASGRRAGIYASTSVWNDLMSDSRYHKWACWVAEWNEKIKCSYQGGLNLWQYSSTAHVLGITDDMGNLVDVDLDLWLGDIGDIGTRYLITKTSPTCTKAGKVVYLSTDGKTRWVEKVASPGHKFVGGICSACGAASPGASAVNKFTDVNKNAWYYKAVRYVVQTGLFSGVSNTSFVPDGTMTRAMMVTVLWRLAGRPTTVAYNPFQDVAPGMYYTEAVVWAYHQGIAAGMTKKTFEPDLDITREQMATFLYRYSGAIQLSLNSLHEFNDRESISQYAILPMAWAVSKGLIKGMPGNLLEPAGTATRAQVATILQRYVQNSAS